MQESPSNIHQNHPIIGSVLSQSCSHPQTCSLVPKSQAVSHLLVAVVDQEVGGVGGDTGDDTLESARRDVLAKAGGALAKAEEVGGDTSNMGRGHGSTRDGVGLAVGPGGGDVGTGGKDIDTSAEVGVVGKDIIDVSGTDSAGRSLRSRRRGRGIGGGVAGGDGKEEAGAGDGGSGRVDSSGGAATERHVDNNTVGAVLRRSIIDDELHTGNDTGVGASTVVAEDLDSEEGGLLGDTVGQAADGASNVSTVALAIGVAAVGEVGQEAGAALEVL